MPLFLSMTLCGIVGTLFYIVLEPVAKVHLSVQWRRVYLILNILMYLLPLPYFHAQYRKLFYKLPVGKVFHILAAGPECANVTAGYIQIAEGRIYVPHMVIYVLTSVVLITGAVLSGRQIHRYYRIKNFIRDASVDITCLKHGSVRQKIPQNARIYLCGDMDTPFAIGVFHPCIVLPDLDWPEAELSLIIEHEVTHIRQCDNFVKILSLAVFALNFYNPLGYYVVKQWNEVAELSCDMSVIAGRSREEARIYGNLLIDIAQRQDGSGQFPFMGFNSHENLMKKRICGIKDGIKNVRVINRLLGVGVMCVALLVSSFPVLAYLPEDVMRGNYIYDEILFTGENAALYGDTGGTVGYFSHGHDYSDGELAKYKRFPDGGCLKEYYKARRCKWCLDIAVGDWIRTDTWERCPH